MVILFVSPPFNSRLSLTYVIYFSYFSFSLLSIHFLDPPLSITSIKCQKYLYLDSFFLRNQMSYTSLLLFFDHLFFTRKYINRQSLFSSSIAITQTSSITKYLYLLSHMETKVKNLIYIYVIIHFIIFVQKD